MGKVMAGLGAQQDKYLLERVFVLGRVDCAGLVQHVSVMGDISDDLGGHLRRRQFIIHKAGANGAPRHAV
ncbi:MAG TPA: hypothetical protein PLL58_03280, partial [Candidatus Syntrophosphaera sp.]|nr:hypothetical protein [Candidatus Syntrophosphaera sp.]